MAVNKNINQNTLFNYHNFKAVYKQSDEFCIAAWVVFSFNKDLTPNHLCQLLIQTKNNLCPNIWNIELRYRDFTLIILKESESAFLVGVQLFRLLLDHLGQVTRAGK